MDPLVSTKLRPSRSRPRLVARPRLSQRLDPEPGRRLTLVSAPAGFGKSTLLGEWWARRQGGERSAAWLSLDAGDNDPARFLGYLVAAVAMVVDAPGFGEGVLATLRSPDPPRTDALLGALINEMADLPRGLDLVLDDYHAIDSAAVHTLLSRLLERLPDDAHVVLSGRVTPHLPLARLRARGQLVELGAADLAFTRDEAETFLRDVMGLDASAEDVATLARRTEGWIAGLQLAALSLRGRADASTRVTAFAGAHRDVLDFLAEEVLDRQPAQVREFLLETSVLDPLTGPLCDALTGRSDGQRMLERLDRENLFVVALDEERRWYRYHHLFREFLFDRLRREHPERPAALHRKASAWSERNGRLASAIEHALAAADHELAARLIERAVEAAVERGEGATALRWLEALPTESRRRRPRLFVQHAMALVITGRPDDAAPLLEAAERAAAAGGGDSRLLLGYATAVRSWRALLFGDAQEAVDLARRAISLLPDDEAGIRTYAAVRLGDALRTAGDLTSAGAAYAAAAEIGHGARHAYGRLASMVMHARVCAEQGRLRVADEAYRRALRLLAEEGFALSPAAGVAHVGLADLRYERDDLDGAERALARGVAIAECTGEVGALVWAYVTASRIRWARGDEGGAFELASRAECVACDSGADLQIAIAVAWLVWLHLARGDVSGAAAVGQERATHADGAAVAARPVDRTMSARLLHAQGRHDETLRQLEAPRGAAAVGRARDLVEILTLRALALWAANDKEQAVGVLADAVAMAAPEGYIRIFVDEGQPLSALLSAMLDANQQGEPGSPSRIPPQYVRKLLATLERGATDGSSVSAGLPERLSKRELEILRLVAAGESNRQIAAQLFVSVSTVKTHVNNFYRKLGARRRTQAVARARELGLV